MNTDDVVRQLTEVLPRKHLRLSPERTYCALLKPYSDFLKGLPLHLPSEHKLERFLNIFAHKHIAVSTQNQAFNAIISQPPENPKGGLLGVPTFNFIGA